MRHLRLLTLATATLLSATLFAQSGPYSYYPLSPCRAVDTRYGNSVNGGPIMGQDSTRNFQMRGVCGVPSTAKAVSLNLTAVQSNTGGWMTLWPSNLSRPNVAMISFQASDPALANGVIVGVSTNPQDLSVYNNQGTVHVIIDITGYFQ